MKRAELLLPAGNIEKMKYAIAYGADAVYLGTADFSLRSPKSGDIITNENIKEAVELAHKMGAQAYVTLNVFANNEIMQKIPELLEILADAKPDGIIFADPGFYSYVKKYLPDVPIHISTQANILNYETVRFWQDLGAKRVILARELSLKEIEQIHTQVPDMELEVLIHGSMCVAYSGRCLLSDYMTNNTRKSNQGRCAQPCRWKYSLIESQRPGQEFDITEDSHGTYIMNPKDLSLIEYIPDLINAGVCSFKVEGRTKSMYYAAMVAKTYKKAINTHYNGEKINTDELYEELFNVGNRGFSTGFLLDEPDSSHYDYNGNKSKLKSTFMGLILGEEAGKLKIKTKNRIDIDETIDLITPNNAVSAKVVEIIDQYGENKEVANTNEELLIKLDTENIPEDWQLGIIRQRIAEKGQTKNVSTETYICS